MGIYLNPGNEGFQEAIHSRIYVDKTGLISCTNELLGTLEKNICISRPRRFGKTMAAEMLAAYYSYGIDSSDFFKGLEVTKIPSYEKHLNKYDVLFLNIQKFLSRTGTVVEMIDYLQKEIIEDIKAAYPNQIKSNLLARVLDDIYVFTGRKFVIIIDEWDCIFREYKNNTEEQNQYLNFLRDMLKDAKYTVLVYMTGILPIKKYGTHSALNMFGEYSMTDPGMFARYVGFTDSEVQQLCEKFNMEYSEAERWYDGYYLIDGLHVYNPKSVVDAMTRKRFGNYWAQTETYEALRVYIDMNYDGLKDAIIKMMGEERYQINSRTFQNDMTTFAGKDDVLTLLVHLGYLAYDADTCEVFIPNEEVKAEFATAVKSSGWAEIVRTLANSEKLLQATWNQDIETVARGMDEVHMDTTSVFSYNDENSLSCVLTLAYYSAKAYYIISREMPAGKGFADMVFLPRKKHQDKPAMIIELKWDKPVSSAIEQIHDRKYVKALKDYKGEVLLVGINYNKYSKEHQCRIEKIYI